MPLLLELVHKLQAGAAAVVKPAAWCGGIPKNIKNMRDNSIIDIDGTKAAFLRAAGGETSSPVVTPNGLADFGVTFLSNLMAMLKPRLATGGQEYGLASEYAKRIGRSLNTVKDWLRNLEAKDMIHPIQGAPSKPGAVGDTLYNFAEVDAALREVRKQNKEAKAA